MQICFYFPSLQNDQNNAIFGSMYESFFNELKKLGVDVIYTTKFDEIKGDVLVTSIGSGWERTAAKAMFYFKGPVVLSVYNSYICFYKSFLKRWKSRFLFAYNPDFAKLNYEKYNSVGIPYYHLPFGSDPKVFKPIEAEKKYDITFLGNGNSGFGREKYIQKLVQYAQDNNLNLFIAGSGWDKYGYPYRIVKHGVDTNLLYNQTKVCINIHNDRQYAGDDVEMDANNRLFDLAMAGCCQVSNGEKMICRYFDITEVATADNSDEWIEKIDFYLKNDLDRINLGNKAREKAVNEHTWEKRAFDFLCFIKESYTDYENRNQNVSMFNLIMRKLDQYVMPTYLYKEIRIIRFVLLKLGLYKEK